MYKSMKCQSNSERVNKLTTWHLLTGKGAVFVIQFPEKMFDVIILAGNIERILDFRVN